MAPGGTSAPALDDRQPLEVAPAGVAAALEDIESLMQQHRGRILRFVAFSLNDQDAAETITQECFLKAYRSRAQFRGECAVSTWLTWIAWRLICDHTRTDRFKFWKAVHARAVDVQEVAGSLAGSASSPESQVIARQQVARVMRLLEDLPQRQRSVFTLHFLEGQRVDEIAASLDLPRSTVKTHLYRSTAKMRKLLGGAVS